MNKFRLVFFLSLICLSRLAFSAWPDDKPIEVLVGYAPGGTTDVMARTIAPYIAKNLGNDVQVVIVNRPGASGEIATNLIMRAKPDGYTLGIVNLPGYFFVPMFRKTAYETKNISLIGRVVSDPTVVVVRKDSKLNSMQDVIDTLKRSSKSISAGHNGVGTNGHLAMLQFEKATGTQFNAIPYNGSAQQKIALGGDHLDVAFLSASEVPNPDQEATPSKILSQFTRQKVERIKNIPTSYELGIPVEMTAERGFAGPVGIPVQIQQRFQKALEAAIIDPDFIKSAKNDGPFLSYFGGAEWTKQIDKGLKNYEDLARNIPKE